MSNRDWALGLHRAFVQGVNDKLFPAFENIEAEADKFTEQEYERLGSMPSWGEGPGMDEIAETAEDRGIERYQDLVFVQVQLHALAVAGLYHLWERSLKDFLIRTLGWEGLTDDGRREVQNFRFAKLIDTLTEVGFAVREQSFFDQIEIASLVANACKHGEGPSFERLVEKAPELLRGPHKIELPFGIPQPDDLWIDAETFSKLDSAFTNFWKTMPEYLSIPSGWFKG